MLTLCVEGMWLLAGGTSPLASKTNTPILCCMSLSSVDRRTTPVRQAGRQHMSAMLMLQQRTGTSAADWGKTGRSTTCLDHPVQAALLHLQDNQLTMQVKGLHCLKSPLHVWSDRKRLVAAAPQRLYQLLHLQARRQATWGARSRPIAKL